MSPSKTMGKKKNPGPEPFWAPLTAREVDGWHHMINIQPTVKLRRVYWQRYQEALNAHRLEQAQQPPPAS